MKRAFVLYLLLIVCVFVQAQISASKLDSLSKLLERQSDEFEETAPKQVADLDHRLKEVKILSGNDYCAIAEVPAHCKEDFFYNPLDYDIYYFFSRIYQNNKRTIKISSYQKKYDTSFKDFYGKWKDQYGTFYTFSSPNIVRVVNINKATKKVKRPDWGNGPDYQTGTINIKYDKTFYYATAYGLLHIYRTTINHEKRFSPANIQGWCIGALNDYYYEKLTLNYYIDHSQVVNLSNNEIQLKSFYDDSIIILKRIQQ